MICGIFHQGSGIGNQLHRYVATRVLAADKGYEWGMMYNPDGSGKQEGFKGASFMDIPYSSQFPDMFVKDPKALCMFTEKKVVENGVDIRGYDPDFNFVEDHTIIEGEFQDLRYFGHRLPEISEWLAVEPIEVDDDTCLIGFRGGEYAVYPDLFLPKSYWDTAIQMMKDKGTTKFEVHTDDPQLADTFFPEYRIVANPSVNWRSMRYAKNAIIANSSFYIFPRLLSKGYTIAPRYWARHNTGVWALPQNYYPQFHYL